jgi:hypothetical protein
VTDDTVSEISKAISRYELFAGCLHDLRNDIRAERYDIALSYIDDQLSVMDMHILETHEMLEAYQEKRRQALVKHNQLAVKEGHEPFTGTPDEFGEYLARIAREHGWRS